MKSIQEAKCINAPLGAPFILHWFQMRNCKWDRQLCSRFVFVGGCIWMQTTCTGCHLTTSVHSHVVQSTAFSKHTCRPLFSWGRLKCRYDAIIRAFSPTKVSLYTTPIYTATNHKEYRSYCLQLLLILIPLLGNDWFQICFSSALYIKERI